jgi:hypothetical protein
MPAPHWADAAAEKDARVLRWIAEFPDDFRRRVVDRREPSTERDGCIDWTMSLNDNGYGTVSLPKAIDPRTRAVKVHRCMWLYLRDKIPYGLTLHHRCYRPVCSNVDHLSIETERDNILDGNSVSAQNTRKTHCALGHPLDGPDAKLVEAELKRGRRKCAICDRLRSAAQSAVRSAAHGALGLTYRAYVAEYGHSIDTACGVLSEHGIEPYDVLVEAGIDVEDLIWISPTWRTQSEKWKR